MELYMKQGETHLVIFTGTLRIGNRIDKIQIQYLIASLKSKNDKVVSLKTKYLSPPAHSQPPQLLRKNRKR